MFYDNDLDFSESNQDALREYSILESQIEDFLAAHKKKKLTEEEHAWLSGMLQERVKIMRRFGKVKIKKD